MQTKRTEPCTIQGSVPKGCLIKLSNIWGSVQMAGPFYIKDYCGMVWKYDAVCDIMDILGYVSTIRTVMGKMKMRKLLLIMGDLATGKSTFANLLAKRYDVSMFGKDTIKEVLGDTIGFTSREENLKLSKATMELMMFLFAEFAKLNKPLILESNFHTSELERLHEMAKEYGYEVLTIVLRGDVDILHQRYLYRMKNENRHPAHLSTTLDVYEDFKGYLERTRKEEIVGEWIEICADDFSYQTDENLLKKIDEFISTK